LVKPRTALLAFVLCAVASIAHAQVYKCEDDKGRIVYADAPCARGVKPLALPEGASAGIGRGSVCDQLLDERRRLAAEADRNARRGRKEGAASASRRQSLTVQYERRCVGISRSR
jgi:uncharacterized protein (UPF0254 family)